MTFLHRFLQEITGNCRKPHPAPCATWLANQPAPYRGLAGPSGPKCRKSLENVSRGLWPRNPEKSPKVLGTVWQVSGESPESVKRVFLDCSRDFLETFRGSRAGGPGRHFRDFSAFRARRARETSVRGGAGSQHLACAFTHCPEFKYISPTEAFYLQLSFFAYIGSRPGKPNQRNGQNEKFMNFAHFCEFWCFSLGKQARFTN